MARLAGVTGTITVAVGLVGIGNRWTVVGQVRHAVSVGIAAVLRCFACAMRLAGIHWPAAVLVHRQGVGAAIIKLDETGAVAACTERVAAVNVLDDAVADTENAAVVLDQPDATAGLVGAQFERTIGGRHDAGERRAVWLAGGELAAVADARSGRIGNAGRAVGHAGEQEVGEGRAAIRVLRAVLQRLAAGAVGGAAAAARDDFRIGAQHLLAVLHDARVGAFQIDHLGQIHVVPDFVRHRLRGLLVEAEKATVKF